MLTLRINHSSIRCHNKKHALNMILLNAIDLHSPFETLKENIIKALELTELKKIKYYQRIPTKEKLVYAYYDLILYTEELGRLRGFTVGARIEKGFSGYSPELRRMSDDHTIE